MRGWFGTVKEKVLFALDASGACARGCVSSEDLLSWDSDTSSCTLSGRVVVHMGSWRTLDIASADDSGMLDTEVGGIACL